MTAPGAAARHSHNPPPFLPIAPVSGQTLRKDSNIGRTHLPGAQGVIVALRPPKLVKLGLARSRLAQHMQYFSRIVGELSKRLSRDWIGRDHVFEHLLCTLSPHAASPLGVRFNPMFVNCRDAALHGASHRWLCAMLAGRCLALGGR